MFHHVDDALEALLRSDEPLLADAVVSFEAPDLHRDDNGADDDGDDQDAELPHLRIVLWRVALSAKAAKTGSEVIERDGVKVRRERLPTVELSYEVTAPGGPVRDRHRVLAAALRTFLRHASVPADLLPAALVDAGTDVALRVPKQDPEAGPDGRTRPPGIDLRVSVALDLEREQVLAESPGTAEFGFTDKRSGASSTRRRYGGTVADPAAAGVDVLGPSGMATVDEQGRFVIMARAGDQLAIMVDPPVSVVVPESGQIVVT